MKKITALFFLLVISLFQAVAALASDYYIELAVFKNNNANSDSEIWESEVPPLNTADAVEPELMNLRKGYIAIGKLRNSPDYTLLRAASWHQDAPIRSNQAPRYIHADTPEYSLAGTVSFYQQRFLFADIDLHLTDKQTGQIYALKQHKRVKPKEMHYFDHPVVGAVLYVQRSDSQ